MFGKPQKWFISYVPHTSYQLFKLVTALASNAIGVDIHTPTSCLKLGMCKDK